MSFRLGRTGYKTISRILGIILAIFVLGHSSQSWQVLAQDMEKEKPAEEKPAEGVMNLEVDRLNAYDYDDHQDFVMADVNAYRKAILKEIKKIKQEEEIIASSR